jgi:hypothetical protein
MFSRVLVDTRSLFTPYTVRPGRIRPGLPSRSRGKDVADNRPGRRNAGRSESIFAPGDQDDGDGENGSNGRVQVGLAGGGPGRTSRKKC